LTDNDTASRVAAIEFKGRGDSALADPPRAVPAQSAELAHDSNPVQDSQSAAKPAPSPAPKIASGAEDDAARKQFAGVLNQLAPLLRQNKFSDAEKLLDENLRNLAMSPTCELIKKEKADLLEIRSLRQRAIDTLRAKAGSTVTLTIRGAKMTGTVKDDPDHTDIMLALRDGPEMTIRADQLDAQDVDLYAPVETGAGKANDMRRHGMLFLAAGEMAKAEDYFFKARDAGMVDATAPYLERIAALKVDAKEAAAADAWKKAEILFASKNWKGAAEAYEKFQRDYAGSTILAGNTATLKTRLEAIDEALGPPKEFSLDLGGGVKLELVLIPAGEFEMGSANSGDASQKPVHKVKILRSFYMGKYVVTQAQYKKVTGKNPCNFRGNELPVENVDYSDAENFCKEASQLTGKSFRLPSEAEWEYACRAGTKTRFNTGDSDTALAQAGWYFSNSENTTHPVGQKKPNAWGLYDMHGNVNEWCQDWFADNYYANSPTEDPKGPIQGAERVLRGGAWNLNVAYCEAAYRTHHSPVSREMTVGFRVVVTLAQKNP
jgi:formylglycine-generating enzyme required for sulfatase activity